MSSDRYFTSEEPLTGDAPFFWEDFRHPRLGRFPESIDNRDLIDISAGDSTVVFSRGTFVVKQSGWPSKL